MTLLLLLIGLWLLCGLLSYGWSLAYFLAKYPLIAEKWYWRTVGFSLVWGFLYGPISVFILLAVRVYRHGWRLY